MVVVEHVVPFWGSSVICRRRKFTGDRLPCCFRDLACHQQDDTHCFQSDDRQKTCTPDDRNLVGGSCRESLNAYCQGRDLGPNDSAWLDR